MASNSYSVLDVFLNFTNQFSDSFLYAYILQIILIIYMYSCVGSGRYWKIMLLGSIFGMFGAMVEHGGTAWLETINDEKSNHVSKAFYCYFLAEIGWIISEFSIPYLNLIKLNTLTQMKIIKILNYVISILFFLFSCARFYIGYLRLSNRCLYNANIYHAHGIAFGITAIADGLLSVLIFIELNKSAKKTKEKDGETFNLLHSFKKSSLFILFVVDLMSVILAIISIFINNSSFGQGLNKLVKPFHALKSNFILILAIDAFIFKMRASVDGSYVVSRYLQKQSKLCSNHGDNSDEMIAKRYKSFNSSQVLSANTTPNTSIINININNSNINNNNTNTNTYNENSFDNTNSNNNNNNNRNSGSNSSNDNIINIGNNKDTTKKFNKGHMKSKSSVSDINYYMGSSEIINNMVAKSPKFHTSASCSSLSELPTRGYLKGKRSLSSRSDIDKNYILNSLSITPMTSLNSQYNGNYMKSTKNGNRKNTNINSNAFKTYNMKKNFG